MLVNAVSSLVSGLKNLPLYLAKAFSVLFAGVLLATLIPGPLALPVIQSQAALASTMPGVAASGAPTTTVSTAYSLRYYGHGVNDIDRVKIPLEPQVPVDVGNDFTLEFWLKATANSSSSCTSGDVGWINGNVIFDRDIFGEGDYGDYGVSLAGGRIAFGASRGNDANTICGATNVADGQWHHIAVTRSGSSGQLRVYVDGQEDGAGSGPVGDISYRDGRATSYAGSDPYLVIGAEKHDAGSAYPSYDGYIDEVRISKIVRYNGNFTPSSEPFTTDQDTVGLYHLDEGPEGPCVTGAVIVDSSGAAGGPSNGVCHYGGSAPAGPVYTTDVPFDASQPGDTTPPLISNISQTHFTTFAVIKWETSEAATSQVEYGVSPTLSMSTTQTSEHVLSHKVTLTNLSPGTDYVYKVYSQDAAGNLAASEILTLTTLTWSEVLTVYLPLILKSTES